MGKETIGVLSIAGFDPSGGAGILADVKTIEAHKVQGMGVVSALTFQNDAEFEGMKWISEEEILKQIMVLERRFEFAAVKIGLIQSLDVLDAVLLYCKQEASSVIWDPIISASAGFEFHKKFDKGKLFSVLEKCFLITPNTNEVKFMTGINNPMEAAEELSGFCNVLLKGGHNQEDPGVDYLFIGGKVEKILPSGENISPKHGSGCVLSSAIASNLALGDDLVTACRKAKKYVEKFLAGNPSLLGVHHV